MFLIPSADGFNPDRMQVRSNAIDLGRGQGTGWMAEYRARYLPPQPEGDLHSAVLRALELISAMKTNAVLRPSG